MMKIANMEIDKGVQNWIVGKMESGEIEITLPNGTKIQIQSSVQGDWSSSEITIHRLNDTDLTIHQKGSSLIKKQKKSKNHTWTQIKSKGEE
tara:strand:- start:579 stop:854 length:276 start_codon:yes stop_codon:yes gene_type:complete